MAITETIDGQPFTVDTLTMKGLGLLQKQLDRMPYPKDLAAIVADIEALHKAGVYSDDEATSLKREAKAERATWPPELIFDPRAQTQFLYDDACRAVFLGAALSPKVSPERLAEIADTISMLQFMRVHGAAFAMEEGDESGPKGGGTTDAPAPA